MDRLADGIDMIQSRSFQYRKYQYYYGLFSGLLEVYFLDLQKYDFHTS